MPDGYRRPRASSTLNQVVGGDRRTALVDAAFTRVAEVGFEGLRLRQVADDAGIDHSTLHHHFATKQDLVDALVLHTTRRLAATAPPDGPDPAARLRAHLDMLSRLSEAEPELFTVTAELDLRARRDPAVREVLERQEAGWRAGLAVVLTDAGVPDPDTGVELVIATVKGVRLTPDQAAPVFDRLVTALIGTTRREEET
jgi:AcrR family transcriptional regulator